MLLLHFLGLAKQRPLLVLFEDAHWADATTLELTRLLLQRITKGPVLLVITSRPENLPALESQPHLTRLTLNRLSRSAVAEIIKRLIPEHRAAALIETIVSRTDGVPLFVEELSKAIAEREGELAADVSAADVPASLHDTLMARLDRLPSAKELAQLAACIGREIEHRLLRSVTDQPEAELTQQLAELCDAELLFRHGTPPDLIYSFKHALVRDAAYESQLKSTRRATHGRILAALERETVEAAGEGLGYHAAGAGLWGKALHYYGSAGKAAFSRASNEDGLTLVAKALEAGERLHGDSDAAVAIIDLRTARGWAYLSMGETQRMLEELSEAEASAAEMGLTQLTCQLRTQRTHVESIFGESAERALEHGSAALDLAERVGDPNLLSAVRFVLGHASLVAGDYRSAIEYLEVDAEASQQGLRMAGVGSSGTLAVDILACLGDAHAQLGQWDAAWRRGAEARAVALESGSPWDMVVANYHQTRALLAAGDADAALPLIDQSIEYCNRAGLRFGRPWHLANLGEVHRMKGRPDEAIHLLDRAISDCAELGLKYPRGHAHLSRAEAFIDAQRADAIPVAEEALAFASSHHHQAFEVSALQLLATVSTPERAAQCLGNARGIAEALGLSLDLANISDLQARLTPLH
jgi:tetratricopeptide (TPR) repeat protein